MKDLLDPITPEITEAHSFLAIKEKLPIHFIESFLEIKFEDNPRVFLTVSMVHQFMKGHNTVNNIAVFYEGILMSTNDFMQERLHPDSKNFGEQLVNTSEKTDRSILGYLLGIRDFWEEGYDAIVKPLNI
jgi:hypothetical protein